jgi:hypothetical protein
MTHRVAASALNLRAAPDANAKILRTLPRDARVRVISMRGDWAQVEAPELGWVAVRFIEALPAVTPLRPLTLAQREAALGRIEWVPAPTADNREAIRITNNWAGQHIVQATIPQLVTLGLSRTGTVWCHRRVRDQMLGLWAAWEQAGLLPLVRSWGGCYVPRLIRGSIKTLSQHAHGSAFDINAAWNGLGVEPPAVGAPGSVRALVPLAAEFGFYWGGNFTRRDGMHFEVADVRGAQ